MSKDASAVLNIASEELQVSASSLEERIERLLTNPNVPDDVKADLRFFVAHFQPLQVKTEREE